MNSLQARLGFGLIVSAMLLFTAQWLVMSADLRRLTEEYFASHLTYDLEELLASLDFDFLGQPLLPEAGLNAYFWRAYSGHYYQVMVGGYTIRSRSLWDQSLQVTPMSAGSRHLMRLAGPEGQNLLVLVAGFQKRGHAVTIAVAEDYTPLEQQYDRFQLRYVLITAMVFGGLILVQVWVVRRSFGPLGKVRSDMQRLEQGEIMSLSGDVPTEIMPLVDEINRLLVILARRLEHSRNALGNLAHAVKTPLTVLRQLLLSNELDDHTPLRDQLLGQSELIARYVRRELKRARVAGAATPGRRFDLSRELPPLLEALKQIYRDKGLQVEMDAPNHLSCNAEREDMLELFGNLLDNAFKWAFSRVTIRAKLDDGWYFAVEDDGPGVPPEELAQLAERGKRADESVGGYGLGLSIAREIVTHYDGDIVFDQSPQLGGFRVRISLPEFPSRKS